MEETMRFIMVSFFTLLATPIFANDSIAEMGAGGLIYVNSASVEMVSEDLFISQDEIRVDYVFKNNSNKDVTSIVAFPMPDITGSPYEGVSIPFLDNDNLMGFSVVINGLPLTPKIEQKAYALGLDVTSILLSAKVSLLPFGDKTFERLAEISVMPDGGKAYIEELEKRGIIENDRYDAGEGVKDHLTPIWTLKSSYWWEMTFPANQTINVSHRYVPAVGGTAFLSFLNQDGTKGETYDLYVKDYCIDAPFINAVKRELVNGEGFYETYISYILKTAQNWSGSIGTFRLSVDKGSTKNFVSFCGDGVKKNGSTTFEFVKKDFYPQNDFKVLILQRAE